MTNKEEFSFEDGKRKLPSGWRWVKLGHVCDFIGGMQPPKHTFKYEPLPGYVRLVQIQDFRRSDVAVYIPIEEAKRNFDESDVMIGRYGPPLFQILRGLSGAYNVALIKTVPKDGLLKDYLYYLLQEPTIQNVVIAQSQRSAGQTGLQKEFVENLIVPLPPLDEQKRIAAILNEKMEGVEEARRNAIAQLEAAKDLPAAYLRAVFNNPEAQKWQIKKLREICYGDGQYGTSEASNDTDDGLPMLRMGNIYEGRILWENLKYIQLPEKQERKYRLIKGDIIFNRTNSAELVGKTAVFEDSRDAVFASYLIRFRVLEELAIPNYIAAYINSESGRKFIEANMARAIGQVNISASTMHKMPIPLPPLSDQKHIAATLTGKIAEAEQLCKTLKEQLEAIKKLPAAFLRQAFNGEL
ncbi:MAG: restriction endonuclease subunit S [Nostoc sp. DedSLP03]|uniref:restriction endonuclease subunit S n=1 Tax=Nostoc sp. DedSLP03 TaxID=3075400 RepID=UPI002AD4E230|nr:restriction endonuclease subunit S [Nostoc sp. DedSLP03]MDZ7968918.1 restriction endonuclease subunit S [Nostoc sp. DedSLP03]